MFRINHQCVSPLFPFQPFCGSHAFSHNRPNFCSVTLSTDSEAQSPLFIKYSWICFSDRLAESTHTFSLQKILSNLVKNIFCPVNPLFLILIYAYINECNSLILILILFDLCQFQNLLCPIRISHLLFLSCKSQTGQQWVSDLIYTLDPWPLTEPDRFQSTKTHVSMPCPPLRLTFQRHSTVFWYSMPWLQVLSNTKSVILGSQSTIKSIIVPSTNMGYLCSLKTLNFCTFSDIHQSHGLIQNFSFYTNGLQAFLHCT